MTVLILTVSWSTSRAEDGMVGGEGGGKGGGGEADTLTPWDHKPRADVGAGGPTVMWS